MRFDHIDGRLDQVDQKIDEHRQDTVSRFNTVDEHLSELKDLIIGLRDRGPCWLDSLQLATRNPVIRRRVRAAPLFSTKTSNSDD